VAVSIAQRAISAEPLGQCCPCTRNPILDIRKPEYQNPSNASQEHDTNSEPYL
jgi:hypothetical protein